MCSLVYSEQALLSIKPVGDAKLVNFSGIKNKFGSYFNFYYLIISKFKSKGRNVRKPSKRKSTKAQNRLAKQRRRAQELETYEGRRFLLLLLVTYERYFPELKQKLNQLSDSRKYYEYEPRELLLGCLSMFLFKQGSRNKTNQIFKGRFTVNFEKIFHVRLAHMDSVDNFLSQLPPSELEQIKHWMIGRLLERKTLHKFRLLNQWFVVAVDGTGMQSYDYEPFEGCPYKEYESGTVWTTYVLEAKIVCANGFSFSIATEWVKSNEAYDQLADIIVIEDSEQSQEDTIVIEDSEQSQEDVEKGYVKQDCELKAFYRLAQTLKKDYPRLPICIAADGLYPNQNVFQICKDNDWGYIINLKNGCLKTVWEEIELLRPVIANKDENNAYHFSKNAKTRFTFINEIEWIYNKVYVNWIETKQTNNTASDDLYFAHVTNLKITNKTAKAISDAGRMRWNIENQGFDEQKNHGYNLCHKYNRKSFTAMSNYYQCIQIAHIINQLTEESKAASQMLKENSKETIAENMIAYMQLKYITNKDLKQVKENNCQFRY